VNSVLVPNDTVFHTVLHKGTLLLSCVALRSSLELVAQEYLRLGLLALAVLVLDRKPRSDRNDYHLLTPPQYSEQPSQSTLIRLRLDFEFAQT
jgi:hypothetical protein